MSITPLGETVNQFSNGILLDQGKQSIRLGTGLNTPSASLCYANSNEIVRISSTVGIGTTDSESHRLKVDNGSAICGISLGSTTNASRYVGISSDSTNIHGIQFNQGMLTFNSKLNGVAKEAFRVLTNGIGIGTTVVPSNTSLSVHGGITETYIMSWTGKNPSLYDSSGTKITTPTPFNYIRFSSISTQNWYTTYADQYLKLQFPYNGIYTITLVLSTGSAEVDVFLAKNIGNNSTDSVGTVINDLDIGDDRLLAMEYSPSTSPYTTLSVTSYFLQNDYIMTGCYVRSGTLAMTNDTISSLSVTLVSRS